jgi:hypothetical protein
MSDGIGLTLVSCVAGIVVLFFFLADSALGAKIFHRR